MAGRVSRKSIAGNHGECESMLILKLFHKYKNSIPSWLWVFILLFGILLVIAIPIVFIYVLSHYEGVASIIFLVIGWFVFGAFAKSEKKNSLILGGAIGFFALMGMAIDQTGNRVYNQPLAFSCPAGTTFGRTVSTLHLLPGQTDFIQNYECFNEKGESVYTISIGMVLLTRLVEYILIGYLLLGLRKLIFKIKGLSGKSSGIDGAV